MKRQIPNIKKTIKKRIEFNRLNQQMALPKPKINKIVEIKQKIKTSEKKRMDELDRLRIYGNGKKPIDVSLMSRNEMRTGIKSNLENELTTNINSVFKVPYNKKVFVDCDVVICVPSYDRYIKIKRLISQFYEQQTKYTFKIILLNDGSDDSQYDTLINDFPDIIYIKNNKPNGKVLHWYCYNQMWEHLKNIKCHTVLQMDDDFILSDSFLNTIIDLFFEIKEIDANMMAIAPHLWSFKREVENENWWKSKNFVDGIALLDCDVISHMEYKMNPVDINEVSKIGVPVRTWTQISTGIKNIGGWIHRTNNSLVFHDGNDDSKLHPNARIGGGVYTQKYIGNL